MARRSWETEGGVGGAIVGRAWEQEAAVVPPLADESDDEDVWGEPDSSGDETPELSAEDNLVAYMCTLLFGGVLSAKMFCIILYWVGRCGVIGVMKWGYPPGRQSGKYARHLEPLLGLAQQKKTVHIGHASLQQARS
jgi:hypothetical protein